LQIFFNYPLSGAGDSACEGPGEGSDFEPKTHLGLNGGNPSDNTQWQDISVLWIVIWHPSYAMTRRPLGNQNKRENQGLNDKSERKFANPNGIAMKKFTLSKGTKHHGGGRKWQKKP
jgi:hypothetical protein